MLNQCLAPTLVLSISLLPGCFTGPSSDDDDDDWSNAEEWDAESPPSDPFGSDVEPGDDSEGDTGASTQSGESDDTAVPTEPQEDPNTDTGAADESTEDSLCAEDYSLCGDLIIPSDFTGTPRSLAIVLYSNIPPAGPPDGIVTEIDSPELSAGDSFPIRVGPVLFNGDYYIWVNLYMEGGGEWAPVNGVDYVGSTEDPVFFDGTAVSFTDIRLGLAEDS